MKKLKKRSWILQSAYRSGGGFHEDSRKKRNKGRAELKNKLIKEFINA
jgi:hypothetical protein